MELINSRSLFQVLTTEKDSQEYIIRYAHLIKRLHEIRDGKKLNLFMRNMFGKEILEKADRCDRVLPQRYKGRARELIEAVDEPECLVHGDIHPKNVMISADEMLFIDFDSFSTGKSVYDLGSLYRSLLCNENKGIAEINFFFNISFDECRRIWNIFIGEYLKDEKEEMAQKKIMEAKLIGTVLSLAKFIKNSEGPELISGWRDELERRIDILCSSHAAGGEE